MLKRKSEPAADKAEKAGKTATVVGAARRASMIPGLDLLPQDGSGIAPSRATLRRWNERIMAAGGEALLVKVGGTVFIRTAVLAQHCAREAVAVVAGAAPDGGARRKKAADPTRPPSTPAARRKPARRSASA